MSLYLVKRAQADLDEIWIACCSQRGDAAADALIERIVRKARRVLLTFPQSGRLRPELGQDIRSYPLDRPYVAFYRIVRRKVSLLRVLHGRRDIGKELLSCLVTGAIAAARRPSTEFIPSAVKGLGMTPALG